MLKAFGYIERVVKFMFNVMFGNFPLKNKGNTGGGWVSPHPLCIPLPVMKCMNLFMYIQHLPCWYQLHPVSVHSARASMYKMLFYVTIQILARNKCITKSCSFLNFNAFVENNLYIIHRKIVRMLKV